MNLSGEYARTPDGRTWLCLDSAIEHYAGLAASGDEGAARLERFFRSALALAQEFRPGPRLDPRRRL